MKERRIINSISIPKFHVKEDIDSFFEILWEKHMPCNNSVYLSVYNDLPVMSRLHSYFVRRNREHNERIEKYKAELQQKKLVRKAELQQKKLVEEELKKEKKSKISEEKRKKKEEKKRLKAEQRAKEEEKLEEKRLRNKERKLREKEKKRKLYESEQKIHRIKVKMEKHRKIGIKSPVLIIRDGDFDDFGFIFYLIEQRQFRLEIEKIKEQAQEEINIYPFIYSEKQISAYYFEKILKMHFHHFYYKKFDKMFISNKINHIQDEIMKQHLQTLFNEMQEFELAWEEELLDLLCEIGKEKRIDDFKSYYINYRTEIIRYIEDHKNLLTKKQLKEDVATLAFCNMIGEAEEDNIEYFIKISNDVSKNIGKSVMKDLYRAIRDLNYNNTEEFTTPLSEIIKIKSKKEEEKFFNLEETGIIQVPWTAVKFFDGYLLLWHPSHINSTNHPPLRFDHHKIKSAFNHINQLFINRLPPIQVQSESGVIKKITMMSDFWESINLLDQPSLLPEFDVVVRKMTTIPGLNKDQLNRLVAKKDEKYMVFLCDSQLNNHKAYYLLEIKINSNQISTDEEGFLFVIKETNNTLCLLYENSLPARSSILFFVRKAKYEEAVRFIHEFFASQIINKRALLTRHQVDATQHGLIHYVHIKHTTFEEWKNNLLAQL